MEKTETKVYTVEQVAKMMHMSRNLAYKLARQKQLPGVIHLGQKRMVFSVAAIDRLLEGNT
jgi:predicted DNA-binding transcriptional regulator AlpA